MVALRLAEAEVQARPVPTNLPATQGARKPQGNEFPTTVDPSAHSSLSAFQIAQLAARGVSKAEIQLMRRRHKSQLAKIWRK